MIGFMVRHATGRVFVADRRERKRVGMGWLSLALAAVCVMAWSSFVGQAGAAEDRPCPNEQIRVEQGTTWLPDCRAYEMVTPSYHGGYQMYDSSLAPDGDEAVISSLGAIAGQAGETEGNQVTNWYSTRRTSTGWQLSPLDPPASQFITYGPLAFESLTKQSLWLSHEPTQSPATLGLYVRSAGGSYSYIGRLNPKAGIDENDNVIGVGGLTQDEPRDATSDFSHVLFQATTQQALWSELDDTTDGESLYEYSGTDNSQPTLVAVEGPKGSTTLIGECGAVPGSGLGGSEYNSLSADGEEVLFTVFFQEEDACTNKFPSAKAPAHDEIYARLHGSTTATAPAQTIQVSASECTQECGEASGKEFDGASENGERIFFTSTQKLTNDAVDGTASGGAAPQEVGSSGCNKARGDGGCNLYEFDLNATGGGALKAIAGGKEVLGVLGVAESGARVYFAAAQAIAGSGANTYGREAVEGQPNLYVYETESERTKFIATVAESDDYDWHSSQERTTRLAGKDGRFLLFTSEAEVIPTEVATGPQIYEYDAETDELVRVSQGEEGFSDDGLEASAEVLNVERAHYNFRSAENSQQIAEDGRTVVFESTGALSPRALTASDKGCSSVYEFHASARLSEGEVHLISDGRDAAPEKADACGGAYFSGMDADGENIFINTADSLLPSDLNGGQRDVYDVRVNGGFPPAVAQSACEAQGCEGAMSLAPSLAAPATLAIDGDGNLTARSSSHHAKKRKRRRKTARCPHGKKRVRGKCTRVSAHQRSHHTADRRHK